VQKQFRGVPLAQCQVACSPLVKYTCEGGSCVKNSSTGISKADCTKICDAPAPPVPGGKTIVDVAVATPDLSTLVTALKAGGLVSTLEGQGPFTVFAPTNEAFAALPAGVLANLLKPENLAQLKDVLTYHVVSGARHTADLKNEQMLTTAEGNTLTVRLDKSTPELVFICEKKHQGRWRDCPKVTIGAGADVDASNGVVQVIDGVLLPGGPPKPPPNDGTCTKAGCWFAALTPDSAPAQTFCGEVDAAPRMPDSIWNDTKAIANYIGITNHLWEIQLPGLPNFDAITQGRCGPTNNGSEYEGNRILYFKDFTTPAGSKNVSWTQPNLMAAVCSGGNRKFGGGCGCDYPYCPDIPDNPGAHRFCSLCGPKFNAPIAINLWSSKAKSLA
jgi:uncharacterized surface protein with fasciclin (FAS1) repeats